MKAFSTLVAFALAAVAVATPAPVEERQISGLPTLVCLTGALSTLGSGLLDTLGLTILDCAAGETCTALDVPIVGSLLPIGVSIQHRL